MFHPLVGWGSWKPYIQPTTQRLAGAGRLAKVPYKDLVGKSRKDLGRRQVMESRRDVAGKIDENPLMDLFLSLHNFAYIYIEYMGVVENSFNFLVG